MVKNEVLAVIPARGGSKSIPRKNIKLFNGVPLIAYSIAAGLQAKSVTRVIVSTDDEEIAEIAKNHGAQVPFMRPKSLGRDTTPDLLVFQHTLSELKKREGYVPDVVVQLRPTSPIRPKTCVDQAVALLKSNSKVSSVRGVVPSSQNPYKMWRITSKFRMSPLLSEIKEAYNLSRQKLPLTYWQTGHIDAIRLSTILQGSMTGSVICPLVLDPNYTVDIDNERDWLRSEWMMRQMRLEMVLPKVLKKPFPNQVSLLVLDFDGVLTTNKVIVDQLGKESVVVNRSDGMGISRLKKSGVEVLVLSTEKNPVVSARCKKLGINFKQNLSDKGFALKAEILSRKLDSKKVVYVGNDINDLPCASQVGCFVAVKDAMPEVLQLADFILTHRGGEGAVREVCDLILKTSHLNVK